MDDQKNIPILYIAGTSYSGSSILGYLLGSSDQVQNVGELKMMQRFQSGKGPTVPCSCGRAVSDCPFWKEFVHQPYRAYGMPTFWTKAKIALQITFGKHFKTGSQQCPEEVKFLHTLTSRVREKYPSTRYLLDTSKSIWRLAYLFECQGVDLKVVYIRRGIHGNVASFKGHGTSFWQGVFIYLASHPVMRRFLRRSGLDVVEVQYDDLADDTQAVMDRLGDFLGVDYSQYLADLRTKEFHVSWGNVGVQQQFVEGFSGVRRDDSWKKRLTRFEQSVLNVLSLGK